LFTVIIAFLTIAAPFLAITDTPQVTPHTRAPPGVPSIFYRFLPSFIVSSPLPSEQQHKHLA
jgi:hypothetical protein